MKMGTTSRDDQASSSGRKTAKGTVAVECYQGRLRLRWRFEGKRYVISIGLPESKVNRRVADQRATQIELDIASGNFDTSLRKYKPQVNQDQAPSLIQLVEKRLQSQFNHADAALLRLLQQWGRAIRSPSDADRFVDWLRSERGVASSTAQRYLNTLKKLDRSKRMFGN